MTTSSRMTEIIDLSIDGNLVIESLNVVSTSVNFIRMIVNLKWSYLAQKATLGILIFLVESLDDGTHLILLYLHLTQLIHEVVFLFTEISNP